MCAMDENGSGQSDSQSRTPAPGSGRAVAAGMSSSTSARTRSGRRAVVAAVGAVRLVAQPVTALVQADHAEMRPQPGRGAFPGGGLPEQSVQQQHGWPLATEVLPGQTDGTDVQIPVH